MGMVLSRGSGLKGGSVWLLIDNVAGEAAKLVNLRFNTVIYQRGGQVLLKSIGAAPGAQAEVLFEGTAEECAHFLEIALWRDALAKVVTY